ncbi:hypothetical protein RHRU231_210009 [Rhodococcus ruber]|uniref:Uncharacterized protein n=1 Tax=Rhodococcus ruber TaxID=1830 RepID=A0A098BEF3_9NOCA|nr:hypothetical protein RHRU231_210009 [Rhodococcus ruber]
MPQRGGPRRSRNSWRFVGAGACSRLISRCQSDEDGVRVDVLADRDVDLLDRSVEGGRGGMFHFHGLDDDQLLAGGDRVTDLDGDVDHGARDLVDRAESGRGRVTGIGEPRLRLPAGLAAGVVDPDGAIGMHAHRAGIVHSVVVDPHAVAVQVAEGEFVHDTVDVEQKVGVPLPAAQPVTDVRCRVLSCAVPGSTGQQAGGEGPEAGPGMSTDRIAAAAPRRRDGHRGGQVDRPGRGHRRVEQVLVVVEEVGAGGTGEVIGVPEQGRQEIAVRRHAVDLGGVDRGRQRERRLGAVVGVGDDLGDHRVVEGGDLGRGGDPVLVADTGPHRVNVVVQRARGGKIVVRGVFRVEPDLDRVPVDADLALVESQRLAAGHPQLQGDQVQARHLLGDRMFDLQTGVHFEEVEPAGLVVEEILDRAGADISELPDQRHRRRAHLLAHLGGDDGRGCFLEDLLVAALDRALTFAEMHRIAVLVTEDLDLDVPGELQIPLQEDRGITEQVRALTAGRGHRLDHIVGALDQAHTLPTATGNGLDQEREADLGCGGLPCGGVVAGDDRVGEHRHIGLAGPFLGPVLQAHFPDRVRARTDEENPGGLTGLGEVGVLGEETVAGMDGVRAGSAGGIENFLPHQIRLGATRSADRDGEVGIGHMRGPRVGIGVHRDRADSHCPGGTDDTSRDFPAVGDEQGADRTLIHNPSHNRNVANRAVPVTGAEWVADRARPSTVRVSRGSITPSSHTRPVAYTAPD